MANLRSNLAGMFSPGMLTPGAEPPEPVAAPRSTGATSALRANLDAQFSPGMLMPGSGGPSRKGSSAAIGQGSRSAANSLSGLGRLETPPISPASSSGLASAEPVPDLAPATIARAKAVDSPSLSTKTEYWLCGRLLLGT